MKAPVPIVWKLIVCFACLLSHFFVAARTPGRFNPKTDARFRVQLKTDLPDSSLRMDAVIIDHYLMGRGNEWRVIPLTKTGKKAFEVIAHYISAEARIFIREQNTNTVMVHWLTPEKGDDVRITASLGEEDGAEAMVFAGTGAVKYKLSLQLQALLSTDSFRSIEDWNSQLKNFDREFLKAGALVSAARNQISSGNADLLLANFWGKCANTCLFQIATKDSLTYREHEAEILQHLDKIDHRFTDSVKAVSPNFLEYLAYREMIGSSKRDGKPAMLVELYPSICSRYSGILRERLLARILLDRFYFSMDMAGATSREWTDCAKDFASWSTSPYIKKGLEAQLRCCGVGGTPYDFYLPKDSSVTYVRLSSLKGKVILVDMWSYTCTGCYLFATNFHKTIYPELAKDTNFVVLSLYLDVVTGSTDERSRMYYMKRLRAEGNQHYTFPEYLNIFGGKGETDSYKMIDYYNIESNPRVMLIGKDGKVYSGLPPFFINKESPNVEKLRQLIHEALQQPL